MYPNPSNPIGLNISYLSHISTLFDRILSDCHISIPAPHFHPLDFIIKQGLDGSGNHPSSNLMSDVNIDTSNFIVFMVSPLKGLDRFGNILWEISIRILVSPTSPLLLYLKRKQLIRLFN